MRKHQSDSRMFSITRTGGQVMGNKTYQVAFQREDGEWDIVAELLAENDEQANNATEALYADTEYAEDWYVLDLGGRNINGGHDQ